MAELSAILDDLEAESGLLEARVRDLPTDGWAIPTPAQGWTIAHQIAHLAWTEEIARLAAADADGFTDVLKAFLTEGASPVDEAAEQGAAQSADDLLGRWQSGRRALVDILRGVPIGTKIPWFGPPMSAVSMATARTMETWAHGQDVFDALGEARPSGPGLRHVAYLGVRTRDFAYVVNDRTPPAEPFRVDLDAPDGGTWAFGPEDAAQRVTGPALDFCLLVTRRRHRDDLAVAAQGPDADEWLSIAQAFAGPPGEGRPPLTSS